MIPSLFKKIPDTETIRRIEIKILRKKDRNLSGKETLTADECELYANYLESIGYRLSAEFFRDKKKI